MLRLTKSLLFLLLAGLACGATGNLAAAQTSRRPSATKPAPSLERGLDLATKGLCTQALPILRDVTPQLKDKQLIYNAEMATARCAMSLRDIDTAVRAILVLNRDFPREPEVLYITTHYYSELAGDAAQLLAATSPGSPQARELDAEAFESQEKWDKAQAEYESILKENPTLPGIHYRLGRILLSKSANPSAEDVAEGKKEMEKELQIDPSNASAEFMLGEIARRDQQWNDAITHFSKASQLDEGFSNAFLGLGMALNAVGKYSDAIPPLLKYEKMLPADPSGHYQLAQAYARTGHKQDADREIALQQAANDKLAKGSQAAQEMAEPH